MRFKHTIVLLLSGWMALGTLCPPLAAQSEQAAAPVVSQSPEQLQQLVAPIALYPDELVAQVLAAATYPTEVVEADRWLQEHPDLKGQELAQAIDQQPWDPSVKALTQFPSVVANMDKNLSWTSSLGEAYVNQPQQVMDAVQAMRRQAQQAGNLKSTPQQTVKARDRRSSLNQPNPTSFMYRSMIPGWFTGRSCRSGPAGMPIPDSIWQDRVSDSHSDSRSASSVDLDGAGIIGDSTGGVEHWFSITTPTSPIRTRLSTTTAS